MINLPILILFTIIVQAASKHLSQRNTARRGQNLRRKDNADVSREAIVNGVQALPNTYPWFASGINGCGGSLISHQFVITTANCLPYLNKVEFDLPCGSDSRCTFNVTDHFVHPSYNKVSLSHDLALIKLNITTDMEFMQPVELDRRGISTNYTKDKTLWVAGFGKGPHMKEAELKYIPNVECTESYQTGDIDHSMICAVGDYQGPCNGDSGDPLYDREEGVLVGLVSWGSHPCVKQNKPSVYSRIFEQWDFIENIVCNNSERNLPRFCPTVTPTTSPTPTSLAKVAQL